jgi:SAM-dependent methyltransferase
MIALSLQQFGAIFGLVEAQAIDKTYADRYDRQLICALSRTFRPRRFLELGVNEGRTAELVLRTSPWICHYIGVDALHDHVPALAQQKSEVPKFGRCGFYAMHDSRFDLIEIAGGTANLDPRMLGAPADMVFIDADHSYEGVRRDTVIAHECLTAAGGVVIWHDYHADLPGVCLYLNELSMAGRPLVHVQGTRIVFEVVR